MGTYLETVNCCWEDSLSNRTLSNLYPKENYVIQLLFKHVNTDRSRVGNCHSFLSKIPTCKHNYITANLKNH